jgi:DNA repair exonuclease SbcCD ATPase subunit
MCYYERFDYSCGDHKWGTMKSQCELQYRAGETCGFAQKSLDGFIHRLPDQCQKCKAMQPKKRRIEKAESYIKRWQQEDAQKWRANIESAQVDLESLQDQLEKLNSQRTSVSGRL